jgi:Protein of unknown function (DUF2917)
LLAVDLPPGTQLRMLSGCAWLTAEGEPGDAIVQAGDERALDAGRLLIEGLSPARLQLRADGRRRSGRWLWTWQRPWQALRRQRQRLQLGPVDAAVGF